MGMSVVEFIHTKNKIIFKKTGIVLVPEDQIIGCEANKLDITKAHNGCPYCIVFASNGPFDCGEECPMAKAGNKCGVSEGNSYGEVDNWVNANTDFDNLSTWYETLPEMVELYEEYNSQFD